MVEPIFSVVLLYLTPQELLLKEPAAKQARLEVLTRKTGSSRPRYEDYTEEELEELFDLFGYGTPLFGMLDTGDETPAYPFVFAGIGVIALAVALFIRRKRRYE